MAMSRDEYGQILNEAEQMIPQLIQEGQELDRLLIEAQKPEREIGQQTYEQLWRLQNPEPEMISTSVPTTFGPVQQEVEAAPETYLERREKYLGQDEMSRQAGDGPRAGMAAGLQHLPEMQPEPQTSPYEAYLQEHEAQYTPEQIEAYKSRKGYPHGVAYHMGEGSPGVQAWKDSIGYEEPMSETAWKRQRNYEHLKEQYGEKWEEVQPRRRRQELIQKAEEIVGRGAGQISGVPPEDRKPEDEAKYTLEWAKEYLDGLEKDYKEEMAERRKLDPGSEIPFDAWKGERYTQSGYATKYRDAGKEQSLVGKAGEVFREYSPRPLKTLKKIIKSKSDKQIFLEQYATADFQVGVDAAYENFTQKLKENPDYLPDIDDPEGIAEIEAAVSKNRSFGEIASEMWESIKDDPDMFIREMLGDIVGDLHGTIPASILINQAVKLPLRAKRALVFRELMRSRKNLAKAVKRARQAKLVNAGRKAQHEARAAKGIMVSKYTPIAEPSVEEASKAVQAAASVPKVQKAMQAETRAALTKQGMDVRNRTLEFAQDVGVDIPFDMMESERAGIDTKEGLVQSIPASIVFGAIMSGSKLGKDYMTSVYGPDAKKISKAKFDDIAGKALNQYGWMEKHPEFEKIWGDIQESVKHGLYEDGQKAKVSFDVLTEGTEYFSKDRLKKAGYPHYEPGEYATPASIDTDTWKDITVRLGANIADFVEERVHEGQGIIKRKKEYADLQADMDDWYKMAGKVAEEKDISLPSGMERFGQVAMAHLGYADDPKYKGFSEIPIPVDMMQKFTEVIKREFKGATDPLGDTPVKPMTKLKPDETLPLPNEKGFSIRDAARKQVAENDKMAAVVSTKPGNDRGYVTKGATISDYMDYHDEVFNKIAPKGTIKILDEAGIPNKVEHGMGTWEGAEPNFVIRLPKADMDEATNVASLLGFALNQDAVITMKPKYKIKKENAMPGVVLRRKDGKRLSINEILELSEALNPEGSTDGIQISTQFQDVVSLDGSYWDKMGSYGAEDIGNYLDKIRKLTYNKYELDGYFQEGNYVDHGDYGKRIQEAGYSGTAGKSSNLFKRSVSGIYLPAREAFKKRKGWKLPESDPGYESVGRLLSARKSKPTDIDKPPSQAMLDAKHFERIAPFLTDKEKAKMNKGHVRTFLEVWSKAPKIVEDLVAAAKTGEVNRGWYEDASISLHQLFGHDATRFIGLLAATSPQVPVRANLLNALKIWNEWETRGRTLDHGQIRDIVEHNTFQGPRDTMKPNVIRALTNKESQVRAELYDPKRGPMKVDAFSHNLMNELEYVTVDTWMMKLAGFIQEKRPTKAQYKVVSAAVRRAAERLGWLPAEVQETSWSFIYALSKKATGGKDPVKAVFEITPEYIRQQAPQFIDLMEDVDVRRELDRTGIEADVVRAVQEANRRKAKENVEETTKSSGVKNRSASALKRVAKKYDTAKKFGKLVAERKAAEAEAKVLAESEGRAYSARDLTPKQKKIVAAIEEEYGYTKDALRAGYIAPDGRYVDLGQGSEMGRVYLHDEVQKVMPGIKGWKAVEEMMDMGYIRVSPRLTPGASMKLQPTGKQITALVKYLDDFSAFRNFEDAIEIEVDPGQEFGLEESKYFRRYDPSSSHAEIILDLDRYFETGQTESVSRTSGFRNNPDLFSIKKPDEPIGGERELSFPQTLEAAGRPSQRATYQVKTNEQTTQRAADFIKTEGVEASASWAREQQKPSAEHTEISRQLIDRYHKRAMDAKAKGNEKAARENYIKAVDVAADISEKLKNAGQAIQAASIVQGLTPEGILLYAQKKLDRINESRWARRWRTDKELTPEMAGELTTLAEKLKKLKVVNENADLTNILDRVANGGILSEADYSLANSVIDQMVSEGGSSLKRPAEELKRALARVQEISGEGVIPEGLIKGYQQAVVEMGEVIRELSGDVQAELLSDLQQKLTDLQPEGWLRKVEVAQTIAQLLNPKTIGRNIFGNEIFKRLEDFTKVAVASGVDWGRTKLTGGDRKITFRKGSGEFWSSFMEGSRKAWQGKTPGGLETQFDLKGTTFKDPRNPIHWFERTLGVALRGMDYASYKRAANEVLGELAYLRGMNEGLSTAEIKKRLPKYMDELDATAHELADQYGKYVTYQDESWLADRSVAIKRGLNFGKAWGLGSLINKYPKTPANLVNRALAYSPAGFLKSFRDISEPFFKMPSTKLIKKARADYDAAVKSGDKAEMSASKRKLFKLEQQRKANEWDVREIELGLSRALVGTGITGMGYLLAHYGVLTGGYEKDPDARRTREEQSGERSYQFGIDQLYRGVMTGFKDLSVLKKRQGDRMITYDWMMPISVSLIGSAMANHRAMELKDPEANKMLILKHAVYGGLDAVTDQPMLRGIQDLLGKRYGDDPGVVQNLTNIMKNIPSSFAPSITYQLAQAIDNNRRITYDPNPFQEALNRVISKIPFWSETLPQMYTTLGVPKERYRNNNNTVWGVFFNPAFVDKYDVDPQMQAILQPFDDELLKRQFPRVAPRKLRVKRRGKEAKEYILSGNQIAELQKLSGEYTQKIFDRSLTDATLKRLKSRTPMEQEEYLARLVNRGWSKAKREFLKTLDRGTEED